MKQYDFVAIGDITTDSFIKLKDATVSCDIDRVTCKICMRFGDKIPFDGTITVPAVGNSPNAAVAAARLGLSAALVTNVGNDRNGEEDIDSLKRNGVATEFMTVNEGMASNHHYVLLFEAERTILVKHERYPYQMPDIGSPAWVYLSSLGEDSLPFHHEIAEYLTGHPEIKLAFQPGTFQIELGYDTLSDIYKLTELFFCNTEEARLILNTKEKDIGKLLESIRGLGPNVAVITDGPAGAYAYDGKEKWRMPMYPDQVPPLDRTGAGDSFASTFTVACALGKTIPEALAWGPVNSMSVVQQIGAQAGLLTRDRVEHYLKNAPEGYRVEKME